MKIALVGMPNCGKSTLFNRLTHGHAHTGNRAGVTVEVLRGTLLLDGTRAELLDLPGIYGTEAHSADEAVTWQALRDERPDLVLFVADGTQLPRAEPLLGTVAKQYPTVLALNMCDELRRAGQLPHVPSLSARVGVPVVPISAARGEGLDELCEMLKKPPEGRGCSGCKACRMSVCNASMHECSRANGLPRAAGQNRADRLFLSPVTGTLCFVLLFGAVLRLSFGPVGNFLCDRFLTFVLTPPRAAISHVSAPMLRGFLEDGLLAGVGAVLGFLPRLFLLFTLFSLLEESGYLSRVAVLADAPLRFFGLHGGAAVSLLLGLGCSVPAVLSARHIGDDATRRRVLFLAPLVCCSARLPVLAALAALFFSIPGVAVSAAVLAGILLLLLAAFCSSKRARPAPLLLELPRFRLPRYRNVLAAAGRRTLHFLTRASSAILFCSALFWLLSHLTPTLSFTTDPETCLAAVLCRPLALLFRPLGFGNWQCAAALLAGVGAKEATLAALAVFCGGDVGGVTALLSPAGALSFLVFFACYCPCAATLVAIRKENGSLWRSLLVSFAGAYALSFLVCRVAMLF